MIKLCILASLKVLNVPKSNHGEFNASSLFQFEAFVLIEYELFVSSLITLQNRS